MAFDIKIKPLVLFDLEDKIKLRERTSDGEGRRLYQTFLVMLQNLQNDACKEAPTVYETVKMYAANDGQCSLFYTITGSTILVIGLQ